MWRFFDAQADWIRRVFDPLAQMRLGVFMTDLGFIFCLLVFWTEEPPLIFEMSALALLFAGIGTVVTAKLAEDTAETADNTEDCANCGQPYGGK